MQKKSLNQNEKRLLDTTYTIRQLEKNENVLIVDDWSETGAQLKAAIALVEQAQGNIIDITCANIDNQVKQDAVISKYKIYSAINY